MIITTKTRKKIEHAFYTYPRRKTEIEEKIANMYDSAICARIDRIGGRADAVANPTECKGVAIADLELDDKWYRVVEYTIARFADTEKGKMITLRYFERKKERAICDRLYITRSTLFNWADDVCTYAALIAVQMGLEKIV